MADVEPASEAQPNRADRRVPIEAIVPNPDQPRRRFTRDQLEELAESIRAKGVIQPLIVRVDPEDSTRFQIVAGERRWRAAQLAQQHDLPVIVRDFTDIEVLEVAIIENIQRADLNPIEEAAGYRQLLERFGHTQDQLARAMGKSRSHIANLMRLLTLPDTIQTMVTDGRLSAGHARALITAEDPESLARKVIAQGLSVRETEKLASNSADKQQKKSKSPHGAGKDADTRALEADLSAALGMSVRIDHESGAEGGKISISYKTLDDLDTLCGLLSAQR
jgi:ParB family chromosome partitioning protein